MELDDECYILGYWFNSNLTGDCYYSMVMKKDNKWHLQMTFRTNKSEIYDDPFSGKDEKKIDQCTIDEDKKTEKEIIEVMNSHWKTMSKVMKGPSDMFLVQGDSTKFLKIAETKDYLHLKKQN